MTKTTKIDIAGKAWEAVRLTAEANPENPATSFVLDAALVNLSRGDKHVATVPDGHLADLCNLLDAASEMKKPIVDAGGRRAIKRIRERVSGTKDPRAAPANEPATGKMPNPKKGERLCNLLSKDPHSMLEEIGEAGKLMTAAFRAGRYALRIVFKGGRLAYQGMGTDVTHAGDEPLVQFYDIHSPDVAYEMGCSYCGMTMPLGNYMRTKFFLQLNEYNPQWRIETHDLSLSMNKLRSLLAKENKLNRATLHWMKVVGA